MILTTRIFFSRRLIAIIFFAAVFSIVLIVKWEIFRFNSSGFLETSTSCEPPCETSNIAITKLSQPSAVFASGGKDIIDLALIFRHGSSKPYLQNSFRGAVESLLLHTSSPIRLHVVTDDPSYLVASSIIEEILVKNDLHDKVHLQVSHVSTDGVDILSEGKAAAMVGVLQEFFTSRRNSYYRDPLFFFSLFLYDILPDLKRVILMDVDIRVAGDITELYSHFSRFQSHHIIAMSHELSPTYRHDLTMFRQRHPTTALGSPPSEGGFPGYNSGVMLIDIPRLKGSTIIESYLERGVLEERCQYYSFQGTLGDQDLYTLIALDHPQLFYTLPCTWNRQLCEWWRNRGYDAVFEEYFKCQGKVQIYHGNCKSVIPPET